MALVSEKTERMRKLAEAMQQEEDEENKMFELPEEGSWRI